MSLTMQNLDNPSQVIEVVAIAIDHEFKEYFITELSDNKRSGKAFLYDIEHNLKAINFNEVDLTDAIIDVCEHISSEKGSEDEIAPAPGWIWLNTPTTLH